MATPPSIVEAVQALARCRDYPEILAVVRRYARQLVGADGATFVLLDAGHCHYLEEDAIAPLWKGQRFPADRCIGGWVARHRTPAVIEDVFADDRIPHGAYRPTFVKSLAVVPVRSEDPIGTIGAYWATPHRATPEEIAVMQALADAASVAWANAGLIADLRSARDAAEARAAENARLLADLTDQFDRRVRAEADRDRLGEQLRQAQKMDALGRMAAGVAHDFNNLLTVINGYAELLGARVHDPTAAGMADQILSAGRQAQALADQLLRFGRQQPFTPEVLDLNRVVTDAVKLIARLVGHTVRVEVSASPGLPPIQADPVQLGQVLLNLAANARDAMPTGGVLRMGTEAGRLADGGDGVFLTVADDGMGMPPEVRARLFEPFFTTKVVGKGTGLGLGIVADVVARHGGSIEVASEPGRGTTFRIGLPAAHPGRVGTDSGVWQRSAGAADLVAAVTG